jgi:RNA polymerase sigma-70 factor, ECF subfamily
VSLPRKTGPEVGGRASARRWRFLDAGGRTFRAPQGGGFGGDARLGLGAGRSLALVPPPAHAPGDDDLLARARAGDVDAHARLFDRHLPVLEGRVRRRLPRAVQRKVSVSDVLQEARIVAFDRLADFAPDGRDGYRAWVLRIAELKAREALRNHTLAAKRAVGRERPRVSGADSLALAARGPTPSQQAMTAELRRSVLRVLETLAADDREVLRLARLEGRPIREVAERMGRSLDAVKKLYGRALARFAKAFAAEERRAP